jgi:hypothetical protein
VVLSGTDSKWIILLVSKKQINVVFILDFDIFGFFGVGEFFDLDCMDWTGHHVSSPVMAQSKKISS